MFTKGRQLSAWLGLVPGQNSSGNKTRLLGISKRGDRYLRSLFVHGVRAVLKTVGNKEDPYSLWDCCNLNKLVQIKLKKC